MKNPVKVGETFKWKDAEGYVHTFTRLPDDPAPMFDSRRILLKSHAIPGVTPESVFGTEPEWFRQRGLTVDEIDDCDLLPCADGY
jgi:hypothetical protein